VKRTRIFEAAAIAAVLAPLAVALAALAQSEQDSWVWVLLIALGPAAHGGFSALRGSVAAKTPEERLRATTQPRISRSFASSFFLVAIVVGAALWGWWGALAGATLGGFVAAQTLVSMQRLRQALEPSSEDGPDDGSWRPPGGARQVAETAIGLAAGVALVAAVGYSLFGIWGAVLMAVPLPVLLGMMWIAAVTRARHGPHDDVSIP
jgi:hypothetical protein